MLQILQIIRYKVDQTGFDARDDRYGLYIQFDKEVEVITSQFMINAETFLTRMGGVIGVGKELLWIILLCLTYLVILPEKCLRLNSK